MLYDSGNIMRGSASIASVPSGGTGETTITFATPFPAAPYVIVSGYGDGAQMFIFTAKTISATNVVVKGYNAASSGPYALPFQWIAVY